MNSKEKVRALLEEAGITINGTKPTDVIIRDERTYSAALFGGTLALGEAFMDNWWDCDDLAGLVARLHESKIYDKLVSFDMFPLIMKGVFSNLQSKARAFMVGEEHYDLGNDLYTAMLDKRMTYTCAVWDGAQTLEEAQEQKIDMLCKKMGLKNGDRVLDIGCGWGSFMKYAAEKYGVRCVGLSVSKGQTVLGEELCKGLPVEFVITDYRDFEDSEKFDHIVSVEMIEAVGPKNFRTYFKKVYELLKPGGSFCLQAIGDLSPFPIASTWMDKYIFPNGVLPSLPQLEAASRKLFLFEHLENIGTDYDRTLMEWWARFDKAYAGLQLNNPRYNERFYRMWKFYLQGCAGLFRARVTQDWQIVFSRA